MNHRAGLDRSQTLLFPERLEDYVGPENPVRFLDAFVTSLGLHALGFAKAGYYANTGQLRLTIRRCCSNFIFTVTCIACGPPGCWKPNVSATWKCSGCWASSRPTSKPSPTSAKIIYSRSRPWPGSSRCSAASWNSSAANCWPWTAAGYARSMRARPEFLMRTNSRWRCARAEARLAEYFQQHSTRWMPPNRPVWPSRKMTPIGAEDRGVAGAAGLAQGVARRTG